MTQKRIRRSPYVFVRKDKNMERNFKTYNRNFTLLLYPEDESHTIALEYIKKHYDYEYITHNKDITEDGELKKEHIHCVIRVGNNPRWITAVAEELQIPVNYIEGCNLDKQLRYLIHFDNPDKHQYDITECKGNMTNRLMESINKDKMTELEKINKMIELINNTDGYISIYNFTSWCCKAGCYDAFRRSQMIFLKMLDENNAKYAKKENNNGGIQNAEISIF